MIVGAFWFLIANASVLLASSALVRRFETGKFYLDGLIFLVVRLCLISAAIQAAGVTGTLTPTGLGLSGVLILSVLLALGEHRRLKIPEFPEVGLGLGVMTALVVARLLAQVWFFSPYSGDVLSYHLPKVAEWVRAGEFTREMGIDTHVTFPAGLELLETWWVVFFRHDVLIEMGGVEFLTLGFFACTAMGSELGLGERPAFFAGLLFVLTPALYFQATSCANDGAVAGLAVATFALVLACAPVGLVVMTAGLGCGVKPTYAYALTGAVLLWWTERRKSRPDGAARRLSFCLGGLGLVVGGFWYVRNWFWFGNPIHPVGLHGLVGSHPIQSGLDLSSLARNFSALINTRIYDATVAYGPYTVNTTGWGALPLGVGFISILSVIRGDPRWRWLALSFSASLISVLMFVKHDPWCMRFALFYPCLFAPAVAQLASQSRVVLAAAWIAVGIDLLGTNLPDQLPMEGFRRLGGQPWRERTVAKLTRMWQTEDAVGYFVDNRNLAYLLYRPDFSCRVVYLRATTADGLLDEIRTSRLRLIYAVPGQLKNFRVLQECIDRGCLRNLQGQLFTVVE